MGASLKFEAEFFRKSNNLTVAREKKIRSIQVRTVHMLLLLALVLLTGLVISGAADFLLHWDALQVRQFRLRRQPLFSGARVAGILKQYGGNILAMDLQGLQEKLLGVPEVAGTSIRRILPDTVEIDFTLRPPFFQSFQDGRYRLLDAGGLELGEAAECPAGLVSLRANEPAAVEAIAAFSSELKPLRAQIEYVAYSEPYGVVLKLLAAPETFYPGEGDFAAKIRRYFSIKARLPFAGDAIRSVDLRIPGRIYFEFAEPQRGTP
ncbi:MAG: FtsQ-type POTRA domain-containing protein [Thiobacillaceae bacterium]|nr:FtsQ-type POTRA domain-containing protein [Thiobacillaceae bacterium]